jgi:hypothetical protein
MPHSFQPHPFRPLLILALCTGLFAGCGANDPVTGTANAVTANALKSAVQSVSGPATGPPIVSRLNNAQSTEFGIEEVPVLYDEIGWPPLVDQPPLTADAISRHTAAETRLEKLKAAGVSEYMTENGFSRYFPYQSPFRWLPNRYCTATLCPNILDKPVIGDQDLSLVNDLYEVRVLNLRDLAITDQGLQQLRPIPHLRWLTLHETQVTPAGLALVGSWAPNLSRFDATGVDDTTVSMLLTQKYLVSLHLYECRLTDQGFARLGPKLSHLVGLSLRDHKLSELALASLSSAADLSSLSLRPARLSALRAVAGLKKLRTLHVTGDMTNAGMLEIRPILPQLTTLSIHNAQWTDEGAEMLRACANLRWLSIVEAPLTDKACQVLAELPKLERVLLKDTACTPKGIEQLKAARPKLNILD